MRNIKLHNLLSIIVSILLSTALYSQTKKKVTLVNDEDDPKEIKPIKEDKNAAYKETLTDEDLADSRNNYKSKIYEGNYFNVGKSKLSVSYIGHSDFRHFTDIAGFEFIYGRQGDYSWFEFLLSNSKVKYSSVTEKNVSSSANPTEIEEETSTLFSLGPGISYKSTMIQNIFTSSKFTEATTVYLLYYIFSEDFEEKEYKGIGLRTDFTLNYPLGLTSSFGWKFSYQLAPLKRAEEFDNESSSARTQLISYLGMAFELSYFF